MRLFVAAWPPPGTVDRLRPVVEGLRRDAGVAATALAWTAPERWHVTLEFLGEGEPSEIATMLERAATSPGWPAAAPIASIGPSTATFPPSTLFLPVDGLSSLAVAARRAVCRAAPRTGLAGGGERDERDGAGAEAPHPSDLPDQPFVGHLTVGRARRRAPAGSLAALSGRPVPAAIAWAVTAVRLVATEQSAGRSRYVTVCEVPVGDPEAAPAGGPGTVGPPSNVCSGLE